MTKTVLEPAPQRPSEAPLKLPALHRPYLVVVGLWSLALVAEPFVTPPELWSTAFWMTLGFVAFVLLVHYLWLRMLLRDGTTALRPSRVMGPATLAVITVLSALLLIVPLWTVLVVATLLRVTRAAFHDPRHRASVALARHAAEARHLLVGVLLVSLIDWIIVLSTRPEEGDSVPSVIAQLGPVVAGATATLRGILCGQYLWFTSRATPVLYRSWRMLVERRRAEAAVNV
jgi:hypothetical protein